MIVMTSDILLFRCFFTCKMEAATKLINNFTIVNVKSKHLMYMNLRIWQETKQLLKLKAIRIFMHYFEKMSPVLNDGAHFEGILFLKVKVGIP